MALWKKIHLGCVVMNFSAYSIFVYTLGGVPEFASDDYHLRLHNMVTPVSPILYWFMCGFSAFTILSALSTIIHLPELIKKADKVDQ